MPFDSVVTHVEALRDFLSRHFFQYVQIEYNSGGFGKGVDEMKIKLFGVGELKQDVGTGIGGIFQRRKYIVVVLGVRLLFTVLINEFIFDNGTQPSLEIFAAVECFYAFYGLQKSGVHDTHLFFFVQTQSRKPLHHKGKALIVQHKNAAVITLCNALKKVLIDFQV